MASGIYNRMKANLLNKVVDWEADTIQVSLYDTNHGFTAGDNVYTTTNELATSGGYTQGGTTLANAAVTQAATTKADGDDTTWASASFTAYHAVIWDDTPAGNDLVCSFDFGGAKTVSAGTFTIQWHSDGILTLA